MDPPGSRVTTDLVSERLAKAAVIAPHRRLDEARAIVVGAAHEGKAQVARVREEQRRPIQGNA
jgi:hypothetical protein